MINYYNMKHVDLCFLCLLLINLAPSTKANWNVCSTLIIFLAEVSKNPSALICLAKCSPSSLVTGLFAFFLRSLFVPEKLFSWH